MSILGTARYRILLEIEIDMDEWVADRQPTNRSEDNVRANIQHETELACQDKVFIELVGDHFQAHGGVVRVLAPSRPAYS